MSRLLPLLLLAPACFENGKSPPADGGDSAEPADSGDPEQEDTGAPGDSADSGEPDDTGSAEDTGAEPAACVPTLTMPDGLILDDSNAATLCASGDSISAAWVLVNQDYTGTDLSPLSCVCEATQGLYVRQAPGLETLDGLQELRVGSDLRIDDNPVLRETDALADVILTAPLERLWMDENPQLESLTLPPTPGLTEGVDPIGHLRLRVNPLLVHILNADLERLEELEVTGCDSLSSLDVFSTLSEIGHLQVKGNENLESLGLEALARADLLDLQWNPRLEQTGPLPALQSIGLLTVDYVDRWSFAGWDSLTTIDGGVSISWSPPRGIDGDGTLSLEGLGNVRQMGVLGIDYAVVSDFSTFESLDALGGLVIRDAQVSSLTGLEQIRTMEYMVILSTTGLTGLHGLDNLQTLSGGLLIEDLPDLETLEGLQSLTSIGESFWLKDLPALPDLDGMNALQSVGENVFFYNLPALGSLQGTEALTTIDGALWLWDLRTLGSVQGLSGLQSIGGRLHLDQTGVESLDGLASLSDYGALILETNPALASIALLPPVTTLSEVYLHWNPLLSDLSGLEGLQEIRADSYDPLGTGSIYLWGNAGLSDISALHGVQWVEKDLTVARHPLLPAEDAQALVDAIGLSNIGGVVDLFENGS